MNVPFKIEKESKHHNEGLAQKQKGKDRSF